MSHLGTMNSLPTLSPTNADSENVSSFLSQLKDLGKLHKSGVISSEEFMEIKQSIMKSCNPFGAGGMNGEDALDTQRTTTTTTMNTGERGRRESYESDLTNVSTQQHQQQQHYDKTNSMNDAHRPTHMSIPNIIRLPVNPLTTLQQQQQQQQQQQSTYRSNSQPLHIQQSNSQSQMSTLRSSSQNQLPSQPTSGRRIPGPGECFVNLPSPSSSPKVTPQHSSSNIRIDKLPNSGRGPNSERPNSGVSHSGNRPRSNSRSNSQQFSLERQNMYMQQQMQIQTQQQQQQQQLNPQQPPQQQQQQSHPQQQSSKQPPPPHAHPSSKKWVQDLALKRGVTLKSIPSQQELIMSKQSNFDTNTWGDTSSFAYNGNSSVASGGGGQSPVKPLNLTNIKPNISYTDITNIASTTQNSTYNHPNANTSNTSTVMQTGMINASGRGTVSMPTSGRNNNGSMSLPNSSRYHSTSNGHYIPVNVNLPTKGPTQAQIQAQMQMQMQMQMQTGSGNGRGSEEGVSPYLLRQQLEIHNNLQKDKDKEKERGIRWSDNNPSMMSIYTANTTSASASASTSASTSAGFRNSFQFNKSNSQRDFERLQREVDGGDGDDNYGGDGPTKKTPRPRSGSGSGGVKLEKG